MPTPSPGDLIRRIWLRDNGRVIVYTTETQKEPPSVVAKRLRAGEGYQGTEKSVSVVSGGSTSAGGVRSGQQGPMR